jgi:hypothetical protein
VVRHGGDQSRWLGVVAEGLAEVDEQVAIPGSKDETCAELEGVRSQLVLAATGGLGSVECFGIVGAKKMKQVSGLQSCGPIGFAIGVDKQRKRDPGFVSKQSGIVQVPEADRGKGGSCFSEPGFVFAQLRDVLAAKDSTIMPQEHNDRRRVLPERAEADVAARSFRQHKIRKPGAEGVRHEEILSDRGETAVCGRPEREVSGGCLSGDAATISAVVGWIALREFSCL